MFDQDMESIALQNPSWLYRLCYTAPGGQFYFVCPERRADGTETGNYVMLARLFNESTRIFDTTEALLTAMREIAPLDQWKLFGDFTDPEPG
ncbi:MAG TPA: hypothetical protein VNJ09_07840 [Chthonomonadales bacterium]|nr:hypothetical protein [Chthonomonadales bacterium]